MGPDTRVSNGLVTSFQGPHVPETSAVTSPKSQRGKTEHHLIVPLFPLGVFLGSLSHIVAGVRKQTPRRPGKQRLLRWAAGNRVPGNSSGSRAVWAEARWAWSLHQARQLFVLDKPQTAPGLKSAIQERGRGVDKGGAQPFGTTLSALPGAECRPGVRPVSHHQTTQKDGCGVTSQGEGKGAQEREESLLTKASDE